MTSSPVHRQELQSSFVNPHELSPDFTKRDDPYKPFHCWPSLFCFNEFRCLEQNMQGNEAIPFNNRTKCTYWHFVSHAVLSEAVHPNIFVSLT
jgi:hypothetical protein